MRGRHSLEPGGAAFLEPGGAALHLSRAGPPFPASEARPRHAVGRGADFQRRAPRAPRATADLGPARRAVSATSGHRRARHGLVRSSFHYGWIRLSPGGMSVPPPANSTCNRPPCPSMPAHRPPRPASPPSTLLPPHSHTPTPTRLPLHPNPCIPPPPPALARPRTRMSLIEISIEAGILLPSGRCSHSTRQPRSSPRPSTA